MIILERTMKWLWLKKLKKYTQDFPNTSGSRRLVKVKKKVNMSHYCNAGTKGERRCSFYSFLTLAVNGGEWSASRPGRALPPGKDLRHPLYRRLGGPQS
jgi:hypothetical protein